MNRDIVERLRDSRPSGTINGSILNDAADEIERLRKTLTEIVWYDAWAVYERCLDCDDTNCFDTKRCKIYPNSLIGNIAVKALKASSESKKDLP